MRLLCLLAALALLNPSFDPFGDQARRGPLDRDPDLGVSERLAQGRSARISDLKYALTLTIPASKEQPIRGTASITFRLSDRAQDLVLDFSPDRAGQLRNVASGDQMVPVRQVNGHIIVPRDILHDGFNHLTLTFDAGNASLNRNDDFLYSIFVPARAHLAFPCFDQPDLKARWTLTLNVPEGWETLANGAEQSRQTEAGRTTLRFAETEPVSTYLFAFAAGRFSIEKAERNGRTLRMFHRETEAAKVARNRDAIFDLHASALAWLQKYTGIPYPFGKFDFLLVPAFQFGGMEHPGAIFYNASGLLLDETATQDQQLGRASVIAHETAHMWFGDLVTMKWFSDVWMKEVFANYMAAKIVNPSFPHINHDLRFLFAHYPGAYDVDRTPGTNEIRQPLANLNEAGTLYGAIIYLKAPIVMRQLETLVGADEFQNGLREYLKAYSFGNAAWPDLIALLDGRTPEDLAGWSHAWVEERGRPVIRTELTITAGNIDRLVLTQRDPYSSRGLAWNQRIQVAVGAAGSDRSSITVTLIPVHLNAPRVEVAAARGLPAQFVLANGGGVAYGELHLDPTSLEWLATRLPEIDDALTRGSAWVALWDAVLDGEMKPARVLDLAMTALPRERDELNVQRVLSYVTLLFWKFSPPETRAKTSPRLEQILRDGLNAAPSRSLKAAWFAAVRDTAQTAATIDWLTRVWSEQEPVPGLPLAEPDYIRLAEELAVRDVPEVDALLDRQVERIKNPDRKAQFLFVRPALSRDQRTREAWFASLAEVSNRRHEPWVLDGLRYLHHPLRTSRSEPLILPSLEMLREIQRTGDIFFPKRWIDATLNGYRSPSAAATVRTFVDRLPPAYPERLRRVILSSADDLFRASAMR